MNERKPKRTNIHSLEKIFNVDQGKHAGNIDCMQRNPFSKSLLLFLAQMQRWSKTGNLV